MDIRIAVADDAAADRERLIAQIREYFDSSSENRLTLYSFASAEELAASHAVSTFHAVFLDIFMDGMTGVELGQSLRAENPVLAIVFVTSSPDMYADAAPVGMFDYLQKPFESERLHALLDRLTAYLPMVHAREEQTVSIRVPHNEVAVRVSDIICLLSCNHYTEVYVRGEDMFKSLMKYNELAALLKTDSRFLECNRGVLVNMEYITSMTDKVYVSNGLELPIKVRVRSRLLSIFSNYSIHKMTELN